MNNKMTRRQPTAGRSLLVSFCLLLSAFCLLPSAFHTPVLAAQKKNDVQYSCPMGCVKSAKPGKCPKCGMEMREVKHEESHAAKESSADKKVSGTPQIPDINVYDQNGKKMRFYSDLVKGKTVAINFIFTTCTTICPPLTATFRKVQQEMGDRVGKDVALISISVDPVTDVPERLKSFAAKFNAQPGWTFVTSSKPEMDQLLRALGAAVADKNDHTPMMLIGNESAGYWTRTYGLASPATLVKVIREAADKKAAQGPGQTSQASVEVPVPVGQGVAERQVERRVAADEAKKLRTPAEAAAAYFPNNTLLTQEGKPVRFFDDMLKGKVVLINFAFTTCTGVCPPMTANLAKVQEYLGDQVGRDINMITLSVDPAVDTPAALKKYAESFKAGPGWYFLTGEKKDVDAVLAKLGGYVEDKLKHSSVLLVGNTETGEWMKVFAMAKPAEIAEAVRKVAASKK